MTASLLIDQLQADDKNWPLDERGFGKVAMTSVNYGRDCKLELPPAEGSEIVNCELPQGTPLADTMAAVRAALGAPLDFPPLNQMVLPDDRVAIAVQPGIACASELVAGVITALMEAGSPPEFIQVVRDKNDDAITDRQLLTHLEKGIRDRIEIIRHDSADRDSLAFLGPAKNGEPVYVNRALGDAEVVIPIGVLSHDRVGSVGIHQCWFPTFSDQKVQERFHKSMSTLGPKNIGKRIEESVEASWMLGVQMLVQLVPAGNDRAMFVVAGTPDAVWKRGHELTDNAWRLQVDRRASLVVAGIGGGPEQQTWDNVVRSIDTALQAVETDGAIAICCQLKAKPGPTLRRLAQSEDYESAERAIRRKPIAADALIARRLNRALQLARVYLLSDLEEDDVEDLGFAFVSDASEIAKLSTKHRSCLVLQNAQHVSIGNENNQTDEEEADEEIDFYDDEEDAVDEFEADASEYQNEVVGDEYNSNRYTDVYASDDDENETGTGVYDDDESELN